MQDFYLYRKAWRFDGASHEEQQLQKEEWKAHIHKVHSREGTLLWLSPCRRLSAVSRKADKP